MNDTRPATWDGPPGQPCDCPNLASDCDGTHSPDLPADAITAAERRVIMRLRDWADEIADATGDVVFSSTAYETVLAVLRKAREDGAVAAAPALRAQGAAAERALVRQVIGITPADLRHYANWYDEDDRDIGPALKQLADLLDGDDHA